MEAGSNSATPSWPAAIRGKRLEVVIATALATAAMSIACTRCAKRDAFGPAMSPVTSWPPIDGPWPTLGDEGPARLCAMPHNGMSMASWRQRRCPMKPMILAAMAVLMLVSVPAMARHAGAADLVRYAISIEDTASRTATVEASFPPSRSADAATILYLPVWTPGYYVREQYKDDVLDLQAFDGAGRELAVEDAGPNRWRIADSGDGLVVRYTLAATGHSVSTNTVEGGYAVFNGSATYVTAKGNETLPREVSLSLPQGWRSASGLHETGEPGAHRYLASDYAELVDSPVMAGDLQVLEFESAGTPHYVVYNRGAAEVHDARMVAALRTMADETRRFWEAPPWRKYVFIIAFRDARGGLEHAHSTFVNVEPKRFATPAGYRAFVSLMAHEYQHAFNVKRLRPMELGPFDYEATP